MAPSTPPSKKKNPALVTPNRKIKHKQEASPNSLAKCQRCNKVITKGQSRKGENYDRGYRWWHEDCWGVFHHKYSLAPSGRAKCKKCNEKIDKGTIRVDKEVFVGAPRVGYSHVHFHKSCLTAAELGDLKLGDVDPEESLAAAAQQAQERKEDEHEPLRKILRKLRSTFAARLGCLPMKIYSDDVIEELVQSMPRNDEELLQIKGIGAKKLKSFGSTILDVIGYHQKLLNKGKRSKITSFFPPKNSQPQAPDLQVVASLSCEEIVNRKFEDAKKNGYIIEI